MEPFRLAPDQDTEQARFAKAFCKEWPVNIHLQDFRGMEDKYDRIVSVSIFEHLEYHKVNGCPVRSFTLK